MSANFHGHDERECGDHRTVGPHRAWCFDCSEWCYPMAACKGCELPMLRAQAPEERHVNPEDTRMTADPYADLRRTLPDATPGPWEWIDADLVGAHAENDLADYPDEDRRESLIHQEEVVPGLLSPVPADAAYIAAANPDTIARLLAERDALASERPNLVALLAELVDFMGEPCRYDLHGCCQAHMLHAADECPVAQATAILLREERP